MRGPNRARAIIRPLDDLFSSPARVFKGRGAEPLLKKVGTARVRADVKAKTVQDVGHDLRRIAHEAWLAEWQVLQLPPQRRPATKSTSRSARHLHCLTRSLVDSACSPHQKHRLDRRLRLPTCGRNAFYRQRTERRRSCTCQTTEAGRTICRACPTMPSTRWCSTRRRRTIRLLRMRLADAGYYVSAARVSRCREPAQSHIESSDPVRWMCAWAVRGSAEVARREANRRRQARKALVMDRLLTNMRGDDPTYQRSRASRRF